MKIDQYDISDQFGAGGAFMQPDGANGSPNARDILRSLAGRWAPPQATKTALAALDDNHRGDGLSALVLADGSRWTFVDASTVSDPTKNFAITPSDNPTTGRWLRQPGGGVDLGASFLFSTADLATLITLPTNALVLVRRGYWKVGTAFSGGSGTPKLGLASSNASFNTPGDLLGGATGDGAAVLGSTGTKLGTIGAKTAAGILLVGGDTIVLNVFTAFGAGAGEAHLVADILANPGV